MASSASKNGWEWSKEHGDYYRYEFDPETNTYGDIIWGRSINPPKPSTQPPSQNVQPYQQASNSSSELNRAQAINYSTQLPAQNVIYSVPYSPPSSNPHTSSSSSSANQPPRYSTTVAPPHNPKGILSLDPSSDDEGNFAGPHPNTQLDNSYELIQRPKSFFRAGKIFMILATDHDNTGYSNRQPVFPTHTLLVAKFCGTYSICVPIHTYGGRGTTQPGIDADQHAPLVEQGQNVVHHPNEAPLRLQKLEMVNENSQYTISSLARINFGQKLLIDHRAMVRTIGRIEPGSVELLTQYLDQFTGIDQ